MENNTHSGDTPIKNLQTLNYDLTKQMRAAEVNHKKEKAILEQKVELLELQVKENKQREESIKRLQDSMLSALNQHATNSVPQELQIVAEQHKKEIEELNEKNKQSIKNLERQIAELNEKNQSQETLIKQVNEKCKEYEKCCNEKIMEAEKIKRDSEQKINDIELKMKNLEHKYIGEYNEKVSSINKIMDSQKIELSKEAEKLKAMSENAVQDVKYIYEQEKIILNERVEKLQAQVKSLETHKEMISQVSANEIQSNYIKEVKELNTHLEQYKREHEDEILSLKTQRDDALKKVEALEQNLLNAKNIVRSDKAAGNLKVKLDKVKELHAQNSYLQDEMKKYKKVVYQLKSQILKLESSEKRLKNMLLEKDTQIDAMSKKISKAPQDEDIKANYDKKKNTILQEIITKDGQIALLSKQLEDTKKELELSSNGSISTVKYSSRNNTEFSKSVCNGKEIISLQATSKLSHVTIQKAEYQQLVDCQSIVDGCSEARCRKCHSYFPLNDFVAHIESSCQCNDGELPLPSNNEQLMKKFEKLEKIKKQKDQADLEIQRLREELEMLKKKCAVAEEKKAESELSLKTEIKFLIGKLMKYKSKNEKPSTIAHNENISPEQSQDKNTQAKSGITSPGMNCVARSISNFMKSTPHTDRNSNNSQLTSDKKSDYDECLFSPSETKTVKIPQFMKRNTKENSTIRGAKK